MRTFLLILFLVSAHFSMAQFDAYFSPLKCDTWGKPDWTKLEAHQQKESKQSEPVIVHNEQDLNIKPLITQQSKKVDFSRDEIFVRWLISDTAVVYNIEATDIHGKVLFTTKLNNCCGLKIHAKELMAQAKCNEIVFNIDRVRSSGLLWTGIYFLVTRKVAEASNLTSAELIEFYINKNLGLDALTVIEEQLTKNGNDPTLTKKYWDVVNELTIQR